MTCREKGTDFPMKKPGPPNYILHESTYMAFWKRHDCRYGKPVWVSETGGAGEADHKGAAGGSLERPRDCSVSCLWW